MMENNEMTYEVYETTDGVDFDDNLGENNMAKLVIGGVAAAVGIGAAVAVANRNKIAAKFAEKKEKSIQKWAEKHGKYVTIVDKEEPAKEEEE